MLDRQQHCGIPLSHQELRGGQIPEELRARHKRLPDRGGGENEAEQGGEPREAGTGSASDQSQARGGGESGGWGLRGQQGGPGAQCADCGDQVAVRGGAEGGCGRGLVSCRPVMDAVIQ